MSKRNSGFAKNVRNPRFGVLTAQQPSRLSNGHVQKLRRRPVLALLGSGQALDLVEGDAELHREVQLSSLGPHQTLVRSRP